MNRTMNRTMIRSTSTLAFVVTLLACAGCHAPPTAPCPQLRAVIGHAYDVRTCQVLP